MLTWIQEEMTEVSFGDSRLNERFLKIGEAFLERPQVSMNQITGEWADAKACYRFFDNSKVTQEEILGPHISKTAERVDANEGIVLVVQDTTYLDFTHHPKTINI